MLKSRSARPAVSKRHIKARVSSPRAPHERNSFRERRDVPRVASGQSEGICAECSQLADAHVHGASLRCVSLNLERTARWGLYRERVSKSLCEQHLRAPHVGPST